MSTLSSAPICCPKLCRAFPEPRAQKPIEYPPKRWQCRYILDSGWTISVICSVQFITRAEACARDVAVWCGMWPCVAGRPRELGGGPDSASLVVDQASTILHLPFGQTGPVRRQHTPLESPLESPLERPFAEFQRCRSLHAGEALLRALPFVIFHRLSPRYCCCEHRLSSIFHRLSPWYCCCDRKVPESLVQLVQHSMLNLGLVRRRHSNQNPENPNFSCFCCAAACCCLLLPAAACCSC